MVRDYLNILMKENMEEDKIIKKFEQVSELFNEYIKVLPFIELQDNDSFNGKHLKLKGNLDDDAWHTILSTFFELQYRLHRYNKESNSNDNKMLVSKLILSPVIPDFYGRRGFIIKIGYENTKDNVRKSE
jgi:hypothetical protein